MIFLLDFLTDFTEIGSKIGFGISLVMMKRFDGMRDRYQGMISISKRVASSVNKSVDLRDIFVILKRYLRPVG